MRVLQYVLWQVYRVADGVCWPSHVRGFQKTQTRTDDEVKKGAFSRRGEASDQHARLDPWTSLQLHVPGVRECAVQTQTRPATQNDTINMEMT